MLLAAVQSTSRNRRIDATFLGEARKGSNEKYLIKKKKPAGGIQPAF
jgi:hypothetical protein